MRQLRRHHRARGDRFTVQPFAVTDTGFDRMPEGVTEVEQARSPASRSSATPLRPCCGTNGTPLRPALWVARQQPIEVDLQPFEERQIPDQTVLDDLGQTGAQLAVGSVVRVSVSASTSFGWWKAPIMFLPKRVIDRRLAANRRIHLRQQSRRHLDERHAALEAGRGKAADVADDPPPRAISVVERSQRPARATHRRSSSGFASP
jgi:hypothetical protein